MTENPKIEESTQESTTTEESTTNEPVTTETQSTQEDDKSTNSNIENEKKALQGIISAKDKKMSEFEKQQAELRAEVEKMKTQA